MIYLWGLFVGLAAGFLSGLLGIGGGIIIVPLLSWLFVKQGFVGEHVMHFAVGTSLATMVFSTVAASFFHHKKKAVRWELFWWIAPGTVVGGLIGGGLGDLFSKDVLKLLFSLFCLSISVLFIKKETVIPESNGRLPIPHFSLLLIGLAVGTIASMIGVGGGIILVPLLVRLHLPLPQASALSVSCTLPTVLSGMSSAIFFGWDAPAMPMPTLGYVVWPLALLQGLASVLSARLGVHLAHRLPRKYLRKILAALLLCVAWLMLPL